MDLLLFLAPFALVVGLLVFASTSSLRVARGERDAEWRSAASQLGAELLRGSRALRWTHPYGQIELREVVEGYGGSQRRFPRVWIRGLATRGGDSLTVRPSRLLDHLPLLADTSSGHAEFDAEHHVVAMPPALAAMFFDAPTRDAVAARSDEIAIRDGLLQVRGALDSAEDQAALIALARFSELLARRWTDLLTEPQRLLTAAGFETTALASGVVPTQWQALRRGHLWDAEWSNSDLGEPALQLRLDGAPEALRVPARCSPEELEQLLDAAEAARAPHTGYRGGR